MAIELSLRLKKEEQLQVIGMHCATCATTVRKAITSISGVEDAEVNLASGQARVVLTSGKLKDIVKSIRKAGYDVATGTVTFFIDLRPEEADNIRTRLEEMEGVISASVSVTGFVRIDYNPFDTSSTTLEEELKRKGYRITRNEEVKQFHNNKELRILLVKLGLATVFTIFTFIFRDLPIAALLSLPVITYSASGFHKGAIRALRNHSANMDTLVSSSSLILWFFSVYYLLLNHLSPSPSYFFDASSMLVTFILLGRSLESYLKSRTSNEISAMLVPRALKLSDGAEIVVNSADLKVGDIVLVRTGERIPADGVVEEGEGEVDESLLTGESKPVKKNVGQPVLAGSLLVGGRLKVYVTRPSDRAYIAQVVRTVREAQAARLPIQEFVDKVASIFVPVVMTASLLTFLTWYFILHSGFLLSLLTAVSVLAAACPCALGLATPMAVLSTINRAARKGIVLRRGEVLQELSQVKTIVFDKTGTLTQGLLSVVNVKELIPGSLELAAAAEEGSIHPVARALSTLRKSSHKISDFQEFPGEGVYAKIDGHEVVVGKRAFVQANSEGELPSEGSVFFAVDGKAAGSVTLEDKLRPDAPETLDFLRQMGLRIVVATGDNTPIHLDGVQVVTGLTPEEKVEIVKKLRSEGKVAFVGDGVNDAPAMAEANVGIAISSGTEIAKGAGDVVIPDRLSSLVELFHMSRMALGKIRQNLAWAFGYNIVLLPLAAGLLYPNLWLPPQYSALAMSMSSVIVSIWSIL